MILLSTETPFNPANFKGKSDTETSISVDNQEDGVNGVLPPATK